MAFRVETHLGGACGTERVSFVSSDDASSCQSKSVLYIIRHPFLVAQKERSAWHRPGCHACERKGRLWGNPPGSFSTRPRQLSTFFSYAVAILFPNLSSSPEKPIRIDRATRSEPCDAPVQWHVARCRLTAIVIGLCPSL